MRIATWNVNSLKARLEKVAWWLERAQPDVLLHAGDEARRRRRSRSTAFQRSSATRSPTTARGAGTGWPSPAARPSTTWSRNFGEPRQPAAHPGRGRRRAAGRGPHDRRAHGRACGWCRCTPRTGGWSTRRSTRPSWSGSIGCRAWLAAACAPTSRWCWAATSTSPPPTPTSGTPQACHGGTHVSAPEREAFARLVRLGAGRRLPPAPPGARSLHLVGLPGRQLPQELRHAHRPPAGHPRRSPRAPSGPRSIARRARARPSPPTTPRSLIDLDAPGPPFDAGWAGADARIAARRVPKGRSLR